MVTGPDGRQRTDHTVVVFATNESYWNAASRRIEALRPDTNGRYRIRGLPPGEYAVALTGPELFGRPSNALLRQLQSAATRITLLSGASVTVNIRTTPGMDSGNPFPESSQPWRADLYALHV
jgi:hypothetical protein